MKELTILGIRGIPASHGGFETFAEELSLYLCNNKWNITVYCQVQSNSTKITTIYYKNIKLVNVPVRGEGAFSTIIFDFKSVINSIKYGNLILILGYNTAIFSIILKLTNKKVIFNMDGLEWKRKKWKWYEKCWLYLNEIAACYLSNHLIADHPEIKKHLESRVNSRKISMIPYGARELKSFKNINLDEYNLNNKKFCTVIARPEPENSILEIVRAFSKTSRRYNLVVLGSFDMKNSYHKSIINNASEEVIFLGPIYNKNTLDSLRKLSILYIHGHRVGGTNPSLVEALGAGQPILAHDNPFNRWVAGEGALYFNSEEELDNIFNRLLDYNLEYLSRNSLNRFYKEFQWEQVLNEYEKVLSII